MSELVDRSLQIGIGFGEYPALAFLELSYLVDDDGCGVLVGSDIRPAHIEFG